MATSQTDYAKQTALEAIFGASSPSWRGEPQAKQVCNIQAKGLPPWHAHQTPADAQRSPLPCTWGNSTPKPLESMMWTLYDNPPARAPAQPALASRACTAH